MDKNEFEDVLDRVMYDTLPGMTRREYFAGAAMHAFLTSRNACELGEAKGDEVQIARMSVKCAEALLAELKRPTE